jgi:hypothetical protein
LPIGGIVSAVVAAAAGGGWMALAGGAPGHIVDALTPRTDFGGTLAVQGPSLTSIAQGTASLARSASTSQVGKGDIASLITSLIGLKFDLTLITATTETRAETQAQLMDVNADGLPDYVLYVSGDKFPGVSPGSLVAFLKSANGTFSGPVVLNSGTAFRYPALPNPTMLNPTTDTTDPAVLDYIDARVADAKLAIAADQRRVRLAGQAMLCGRTVLQHFRRQAGRRGGRCGRRDRPRPSLHGRDRRLDSS